MHLLFNFVLVTCIVAALLIQSGCCQSREKITLIKPSYSFVQEGIQLADRSNENDLENNLRFTKSNGESSNNREQ